MWRLRALRGPLLSRLAIRSTMSDDPEPQRSEDNELPFMELFNAEDAIENPGEPVEDLDPTDDSDAPAP